MSRLTKLCIVNRNYPPEKGATGYYAQQLIQYLEDTGKYDLHVVSIGQGNSNHKRHYLRGWYQGKIKSIRLCSAVVESYQLIRVAKRLRADFYIVMTDPAFLNFWASKLLKNNIWALWSMDIYPDAFVANRLTSPKNRAVRYFQKVLRNRPPDYLIALGEKQLEFFEKNYYPNIQSTVIPIGVLNEDVGIPKSEENDRPEWFEKEKITFGYVGTIGEAHASKAVIRLIRNLDELNFKCILSCSGAKSNEVINTVKTLKNVGVVDYIEQKYLQYIDVQIVALLSDWTHICVPSKAISALQQGSAVMFIGEEESDTWRYIANAGWRIGQDCDSSKILHNLDMEILNEKKSNATAIGRILKQRLILAHAEIDKTIQKLV